MNEVTITTTDAEEPTADHTWRDRGASLVEYALLLAFITLVCVTALNLLGGTVSNTIHNAGNELAVAGTGS